MTTIVPTQSMVDHINSMKLPSILLLESMIDELNSEPNSNVYYTTRYINHIASMLKCYIYVKWKYPHIEWVLHGITYIENIIGIPKIIRSPYINTNNGIIPSILGDRPVHIYSRYPIIHGHELIKWDMTFDNDRYVSIRDRIISIYQGILDECRMIAIYRNSYHDIDIFI